MDPYFDPQRAWMKGQDLSGGCPHSGPSACPVGSAQYSPGPGPLVVRDDLQHLLSLMSCPSCLKDRPFWVPRGPWQIRRQPLALSPDSVLLGWGLGGEGSCGNPRAAKQPSLLPSEASGCQAPEWRGGVGTQGTATFSGCYLEVPRRVNWQHGGSRGWAARGQRVRQGRGPRTSQQPAPL